MIKHIGTSMRDHQRRASRALFRQRGIQPLCVGCRRDCKVLATTGGPSAFQCFIFKPKRRPKR